MQLMSEHILPGAAAGGQEETSGKQVNSRLGAWFQALTSLGKLAARELNQQPAAS
jgi:hypothetical protein